MWTGIVFIVGLRRVSAFLHRSSLAPPFIKYDPIVPAPSQATVEVGPFILPAFAVLCILEGEV